MPLDSNNLYQSLPSSSSESRNNGSKTNHDQVNISKGLAMYPPTQQRGGMFDLNNGATNTRMVVNESLQDAKGNAGLYNGPVLVEEPSAMNMTMHPSDDPDAPPPPLSDISLIDDRTLIPHGKYGQMVYVNHKDFLKYTGDWDHGFWTRGTCLYTNGNVYTGPWNSEGQPHGPNGKLEWVVSSTKPSGGEDTRTYEGDWVNGMRHGQGTYTWCRTGAIYQGAFDSNQRQGHGFYRDPTTQVEYVGEWKQGVYHGYGQYTWIDSKINEKCVYRGTFHNGKPHGQGIQVNRHGEVVHDGAWENGKPVKRQELNETVPQDPVLRTPVQPALQQARPLSSATPQPALTTAMESLHLSANTTPSTGRRPPGIEASAPITTPPPARTQRPTAYVPAPGSVTVVHDREWMDTVNQGQPTMGMYRGLWLHQNPYQNGVVKYATGEVVSYEGWFNSEGYYHGQGCRLAFRNGDTYVGDFECGLRHGNGLYTWSDGRQYKGTFVENARDGKGTLVYPNSDFYEGQFVQGKRHGHGRFIFASGSMYEGMWRAGQYHGQGTLVQADGSTYVGEFNMGLKHGQGKDFNQSGVLVYEGMYYKGHPKTAEDGNAETQQHQQNDLVYQVVSYQTPQKETLSQEQTDTTSPTTKIYWVDDDIDEADHIAPAPAEPEPPCEAVVDQEITDCQGNLGRFTGIVLCSTKRPHGVGRLVYADGKRIHEGFWKNGSKEGHGRCLFFPQGDFHEGEYQNNLRNGPGRYQWKDGRLFLGEYKDDMRHGKGVFTYPSGDKYDGMFFKGQRCGYGKFIFAGGNYEGEWSNGKYHGRGRLVWGRGTEYEGEFVQGTFHGKGTLRDHAGNVLEEGRWFNGKKVETYAPRAYVPIISSPQPQMTELRRSPEQRRDEYGDSVAAISNIGKDSGSSAFFSHSQHEDDDNDYPVSFTISKAAVTSYGSVGGENAIVKGTDINYGKETKEGDSPVGGIVTYVVDDDDPIPSVNEGSNHANGRYGGDFPPGAVEL